MAPAVTTAVDPVSQRRYHPLPWAKPRAPRAAAAAAAVQPGEYHEDAKRCGAFALKVRLRVRVPVNVVYRVRM
jgi:hypothetical protein